jgi:hypothetical protein
MIVERQRSHAEIVAGWLRALWRAVTPTKRPEPVQPPPEPPRRYTPTPEQLAKLSAGTVTADHIVAGAITANKITTYHETR